MSRAPPLSVAAAKRAYSSLMLALPRAARPRGRGAATVGVSLCGGPPASSAAAAAIISRTAIKPQQHQRRCLSFSFAGPRKLDDLIKSELLENKTGPEIADIWYTYHEEKDHVVGLVLKGDEGKTLLERASQSPFFVQPIFREDGYFMLLSQFQKPAHFLLAYLEDYKMDPHSATPLVTFSVFDEYAASKDACLVRCDIVNRSIRDDEGRKVVRALLRNYLDEYKEVQTFNTQPDHFQIDDFISRMEQLWKNNVVDDNTVDSKQEEEENEKDDTTTSEQKK